MSCCIEMNSFQSQIHIFIVLSHSRPFIQLVPSRLDRIYYVVDGSGFFAHRLDCFKVALTSAVLSTALDDAARQSRVWMHKVARTCVAACLLICSVIPCARDDPLADIHVTSHARLDARKRKARKKRWRKFQAGFLFWTTPLAMVTSKMDICLFSLPISDRIGKLSLLSWINLLLG